MMLRLPTRGFAPSRKVHNVQLGPLVDWLEGSLAFVDDHLSQTDVVDALCDDGLYSSQDFASDRVDQAWIELNRRSACLGAACPYQVSQRRVERTTTWRDVPHYSFCLMLCLQASYGGVQHTKKRHDYSEQGELFERLTAESLAVNGWDVHSTGWSRTQPKSLPARINEIAQHVQEPALSPYLQWTSPRSKDAGLDVVCTRPFPDRWGGRPLYLVQCASGLNWTDKLNTPNLRTWEKLIDFSTAPLRAIAMPFAPEADEFRRAAATDGVGFLLDRHRIVAPIGWDEPGWLTKRLARDLNKWTGRQAKGLPRIDR